MLTSPPGPVVPTLLAISSLFAVLAIVVYLADWFGRRQRQHARARGHEVAGLISGFVCGEVPAADLRLAVDDAESGAFWAALELTSARLKRRDWISLSRALVSNPHSRDERRALRDDSPWRRELAARRVGLLRSPESRRALRRALVAGPEMVSLAAAHGLARMRDRAALRWLLAHPQAIGRRQHLARVAVLFGFGPGGRPELAAALERGLDPRLERAAIEALGLARHRAARSTIERRLTAPEVDLRVAATRALGRLRDPASTPGLIRALGDPAWQVRAQAAKALGRMRAISARSRLVEHLGDPAWWVRRHAAYALGALGSEGLAALRACAQSSPDRYASEIAREVIEVRERSSRRRRRRPA